MKREKENRRKIHEKGKKGGKVGIEHRLHSMGWEGFSSPSDAGILCPGSWSTSGVLQAHPVEKLQTASPGSRIPQVLLDAAAQGAH